MFWRFLKNFVLLLFLFVFQFSFVSNLPGIFKEIDLILVSLVVCLFFCGQRAFYWLLFLGFFLDIYSFWPFGSFLFSLFVSLLVSTFFLKKFFTNRSTYSLAALVVIASSVYNLTFLFLIYLYSLFSFGQSDFFVSWHFCLSFFWELILNIVLSTILFLILTSFNKNLKPVFLNK